MIMNTLYHPAVYAQLVALRQKLAEAFQLSEPGNISSLSSQIDRLQLSYWHEGMVQKAS